MFITANERSQIEATFRAAGEAARISWRAAAPYLRTAGRWAYLTVFYTTAIAYGLGKAARHYYQLIRDEVGLYISAQSDVPVEPDPKFEPNLEPKPDGSPDYSLGEDLSEEILRAIAEMAVNAPPVYPWEGEQPDTLYAVYCNDTSGVTPVSGASGTPGILRVMAYDCPSAAVEYAEVLQAEFGDGVIGYGAACLLQGAYEFSGPVEFAKPRLEELTGEEQDALADMGDQVAAGLITEAEAVSTVKAAAGKPRRSRTKKLA